MEDLTFAYIIGVILGGGVMFLIMRFIWYPIRSMRDYGSMKSELKELKQKLGEK